MIGWYVHHQGLGHRTRLEAVAGHLRAPVTGLSSLAAPDDWRHPWLRLERDDRVPPERLDASDVTAGGTLHWVPRHDAGLARRMAQLAGWAERTRPALVVADVSVEVSLLARLCGVPVVVLAMPGTRTDRAHRLAYDLADALLAPWPVGAHTAGWPDSWRDKLWAVGAISRFDGLAPAGSEAELAAESETQSPTTPRGRRVLLLWGGGGRGTSGAEVDAARLATPGWDWVERSPVAPSPDLWADLAAADVVVTHGGQNAVAEVAAARRPAVVVAQPRPFDEQAATASAVERLGVAVGLSEWPTDAAAWPVVLDRAAARGGAGWARWSSGHGAADAARLLDALVDRLAVSAATPVPVPAPAPV
jgi:hypothetical protein